jgi:5-formyltetrahydrofolate cyclo-ligase
MSLKTKAELRVEKLAARDALDPVFRIEAGMRAAEHGASVLEFDPGTIVSAFLPIRSEIDARPLMDILARRGARFCLPVVLDRMTIVFRELVRTAGLVDTGFGTSGPGPDAEVLDPGLLIIPLSVFDRHGGRIGYGAGHYDRAIARLFAKGMSPKLVGLAFSVQEVDRVPMEPHDQPLHGVITENGYIDCRGQTVAAAAGGNTSVKEI